MAVHHQLEAIRQKLQVLVKQYAAAQKEAEQLQLENTRLKQMLYEKQAEVNTLNEKLTAAALRTLPQTEQQKRDMEKRINRYLKEIDRCLALLNQ